MTCKVLISLLLVIIFSGCTYNLNESPNNSETKSMIKGELHFKNIEINSKKRTYALYVPTNYSSSSEFPIVFYFHGGGGNALNSD